MQWTKTEKLSYLLGALRDGGIGIYRGHRKRDYRIYISQYKSYADEWLQIIKEFFISVFNTHVTGPVRGIVSISNKEIFNFLKYECGVSPNGKKWLTPLWIFRAPKNVKRVYVMGVFDADGSIFKKGSFYEIQISQKSKEFLKEIRKIITEFDIKSTICKSADIFKLDVASKSSVKKFIEKIGSLHLNHIFKIRIALSVGRKSDSTPNNLQGSTAE